MLRTKKIHNTPTRTNTKMKNKNGYILTTKFVHELVLFYAPFISLFYLSQKNVAMYIFAVNVFILHINQGHFQIIECVKSAY